MDIVRAFEHAFSVDGFHLNIIGAVEDPHQIDLATKDVVSKQAASQKGVVINCITSRDGCYWFQANHVAKSIDLSNIRDSIKFFEDGSEKMTVEASTNGGKQKLLFLHLCQSSTSKETVRVRKRTQGSAFSRRPIIPLDGRKKFSSSSKETLEFEKGPKGRRRPIIPLDGIYRKHTTRGAPLEEHVLDSSSRQQSCRSAVQQRSC